MANSNRHKGKLNLEWARLLMKANRVQAEEVPEGWMTMREIAKSSGLAYTSTVMKMRNMVKCGKVEVKKFRVMCAKKAYLMQHYRIINK